MSGSLHAVVLGSQMMSMPQFCRILHPSDTQIDNPIKVLLSLYGIWNLDFFRPFYSDICLGIGILPTLALDYVIAVYPLLLMIISYQLIVLYDMNYRVVTIMWRPFRLLFSLFRRNWNIKTSVVDAYATLFLLSFVKFLSVSFDLLVPTKVYNLPGDHYNYTLALYYAGDIEYFASSLWDSGHSCDVCVCHPTYCHFCPLSICIFPEILEPIPTSLVHPTYLCGLIPRLL